MKLKEKINSIKTYYESSGAVDYLKNKVLEYSINAEKLINQMQIDTNKKLELIKASVFTGAFLCLAFIERFYW